MLTNLFDILSSIFLFVDFCTDSSSSVAFGNGMWRSYGYFIFSFITRWRGRFRFCLLFLKLDKHWIINHIANNQYFTSVWTDGIYRPVFLQIQPFCFNVTFNAPDFINFKTHYSGLRLGSTLFFHWMTQIKHP